MTKEPFTEADAQRLLPDAERVEGTDVVAPVPARAGHAFASGLVRRDDGAMMQPDPRGGTFGGTFGSGYP